MITSDPILAFASILAVALFFGGTIGWFTGILIKRISQESKPSVFLDVVFGFIGFLGGLILSNKQIELSIEQEWLNGELVNMQTRGYGGLLLTVLITSIGAVIIRFTMEAAKPTLCKKRETGEG